MWKLTARGASGTPFEEMGAYGSIADAARHILKLEGGIDIALFFSIYVDQTGSVTNDDTSDASRGFSIKARHVFIR
jgi:hypothetical protein